MSASQFGKLLKKYLRNVNDEIPLARETGGGMGSTQTGWMGMSVVDWEELDKAIDEFCDVWKKAREPK